MRKIFIELFSGSAHLSEVARTRGYETFTIDFNEKLDPDWTIDISKLPALEIFEKIRYSLDWSEKDFVVFWASVPCPSFSKLMISENWYCTKISKNNYRYKPKSKKALLGLELLNKTLEIIKILKPNLYYLENPVGVMRHLPIMRKIPFIKTVSYLDYGFDYLKPTDIFTNNIEFKPREIKWNKMIKSTSKVATFNNSFKRSLIPTELAYEMIDSCFYL